MIGRTTPEIAVRRVPDESAYSECGELQIVGMVGVGLSMILQKRLENVFAQWKQ